MPRKSGSGFANATTAAVEQLFADVLEGQPGYKWRELLDEEVRLGRCGVDPESLQLGFQEIRNRFFDDVVTAESQPDDLGGDIRIIRKSGTLGWIEVKAQTKKPFFSDITQADFVRDGTSFLNRLYFQDPSVSARISPELASALKLVKEPKLKPWSNSQLFLADAVLISDESHRKKNELHSFEALVSFVQEKAFLQITQEGIRVTPFSNIPLIKHLCQGGEITYELKTTNKNELSIQILFEEDVVFTYHLGYANAPGRHKLHARALPAKSFDEPLGLTVKF